MAGMYNIDEPITYHWTFGWSQAGMSNCKPVVNRLLAAIIEGNVLEMDCLHKKGATLNGVDESTFQRILYHIIDNYDVIQWLVLHGMTRKNTRDCIDPDGYLWGLIARAWFVKAYDVMELLAYYGFDWFRFSMMGEGYDAISLIYKHNDVHAMKILKEHGYQEPTAQSYDHIYYFYRHKYPNSKVTAYLEANPVIKRKSVGLDSFKFTAIPKPELEKEGLFFRKRKRESNEIKIADYEDRVRAQREYQKAFQKES